MIRLTSLYGVKCTGTTINLTTYYNGGGPSVNHMFYTYAGIKRGDHITLARSGSSTFVPPVSGKATISIQNCGPYAFFNLSDGHAYSQFNSQANTFVDALFDLRQDASNILISTYRAMDEPVYGWVDNVTDAGLYTIDFNNLTPFPKTISVLVSESMSGLIVGQKAGLGSMGYVMANRGFSRAAQDPAVAKIGYLDGFDEYTLFVTSSKAMSTYHRSTHYTKYGTSLPEEITFPENSLSIENPVIGNFSFSYSSTYTYHSHYWREDAADQTVHWRVYTDKPTTPPITELPEAFTAKYPSLSVSNLTYSQSQFFRHQDGYTYGQLLLDLFAGITPARREFFQDSFQQR